MSTQQIILIICVFLGAMIGVFFLLKFLLKKERSDRSSAIVEIVALQDTILAIDNLDDLKVLFDGEYRHVYDKYIDYPSVYVKYELRYMQGIMTALILTLKKKEDESISEQT